MVIWLGGRASCVNFIDIVFRTWINQIYSLTIYFDKYFLQEVCMKKWIFVSIASVLLAFSTNTWADTQNNDNAARNVIEHWFAAMKNDQLQQAADYLAPQFTSLHTDNIVRDKQQELDLIKNLHMKNYHLDQFHFSQSDNIIVVTFQDKGSEKIDKKPIATHSAGRMAVLQKQNDKWLILAYANLDRLA